MTNKLFITLLCAVLWPFHVQGQAGEISPLIKQTFIYAVKGADTLRLDKYEATMTTGNKPCIVFVFGGGFANGRRDDAGFMPFYTHMAHNGYAVVAIDYRLGMKNLKERLDLNQDQLQAFNQVIDIFEQSVNMAVEDLFDATAYLIEHAADWHIDTARIISCGSSAGAITVLQGAHEVCCSGALAARLPQGFQYAGVISFSGAIFSRTGLPEWPAPPSPILMFHGDADKDVPYNKIELFNIGFYGSASIAEQLNAQQMPHCFYAVENTGHEISTLPMKQNWNEIHTFLDKMVLGKEKLIIHTTVKPIGKPEGKKTLTLQDFMGNFRL